MQITIHTKRKFPHAYAIKTLGGRYTAEGEKYYEDHEQEVSMEYSEIIETMDKRFRDLGGSNKIHLVYERQDL